MHYHDVAGLHLRQLFAEDRMRGERLTAEAAGMRESVLHDLGDDLGSARIGAVPGPWEPFAATVLSVEYRPGSLPSDHNLVNDLHAMVMLHDLLLG